MYKEKGGITIDCISKLYDSGHLPGTRALPGRLANRLCEPRAARGGLRGADEEHPLHCGPDQPNQGRRRERESCLRAGGSHQAYFHLTDFWPLL